MPIRQLIIVIVAATIWTMSICGQTAKIITAFVNEIAVRFDKAE